MNNTYTFAYCINDRCYLKKITANSWNNAVGKACQKLEALNDDLDLLGLTDWEEVVGECENYGIYVSDLIEIE